MKNKISRLVTFYKTLACKTLLASDW